MSEGRLARGGCRASPRNWLRVQSAKLVRDRIPEIIEASGASTRIRRLDDDEEYRAALKAKLLEEAAEAAQADEHALAGEIADVLEVVKALCKAYAIDPNDVERLRVAKAQERGTFADRVLLIESCPNIA